MSSLLKPPTAGSVALLCFSMALLGCQRQQPLVLQREWVPNAEFAGDVLAADLAAADGVVLDVREGSEVLDPVKLVRTGEAQFGVASADRILRENQGGAELLVIAVATWRSPVVFLVRPPSDITSPSGFVGHTVGIQSGTNTEVVFDALLASQGLSRQAMRVVESGWGTGTFETGVLDVLAAFDYDEPIQLDLKNVPYRTIEPASYGVHLIGTAYFLSKPFADEHPEAVQTFVTYLVRGWRQALQEPERAIRRLDEKFSDFDERKEVLSFRRGAPYFAGEGGRLLYASPASWDATAATLMHLGRLRQFEFDQNVDYRFLQSALATMDHAQ